MHLVDIKTLASPEQRGRMAVNVRVSKNHTYVSRLVSEIARHAKYISTAVLDRFYKCNLQKAMETASAFASRNEDIMNDIGTSIPVLLSTIFENTRSSAKEVCHHALFDGLRLFKFGSTVLYAFVNGRQPSGDSALFG